MVGEVSPYVSTPRFAQVCHYPLRGDTPRRPVEFLAKHEFALALGGIPPHHCAMDGSHWYAEGEPKDSCPWMGR
jgi:hypothetical protein